MNYIDTIVFYIKKLSLLYFSEKQINLILRLWKIAWHQKKLVILSIISLALSSIISIIFPQQIGNLTNLFKNSTTEDYTTFLTQIKGFISFFLLYSIMNQLGHLFIETFTLSLISELRLMYYSSLMSKDIAFYDLNKTSDLFSLLTGEIEELKNTSIIEFTLFIKELFQIIGAVFGMIYVSFKLACLLFVFIPLVFLFANLSGRQRKKRFKAIHSHKKASHNLVLESLDNIRIIKTFSTEDKEIKKYDDKLKTMFEEEYWTLIKTSLFDFGTGFIFLFGLLSVIKAGALLLNDQSLTIGNFSSFILYCLMLLRAFFSLNAFTRRIIKALFIAEKLFGIIDYVPSIKLTGSDEGIKAKLLGNITISNVSFTYPSKKEVEVVSNLSLAIKAGQSIGIVGSSGSGKTTIASLLERLYDLNENDEDKDNDKSNSKSSIAFDDINIKEFNIQHFHKQIGYVCQEPSLFNGTILDNVVYGVEKYDIEDVKNALLSAKAEFVFDKVYFPEGLNTNVGERGIQLSGGQKQRIAIARALIKKPSILILDEAMSALDSENEYLVQQELKKYKDKLTVIVIAHRLSSIKECDTIVVLIKGVIEEMGSHDYLMSKNGVYRQLMERQVGSNEAK